MPMLEPSSTLPSLLPAAGEFTMLELANLVKEVVNPDAQIVFRPNTADDPARRKPDITKIKTTCVMCPVVWNNS